MLIPTSTPPVRFLQSLDAMRHVALAGVLVLACSGTQHTVADDAADDVKSTKSALEADPKGWIDIMPPADLKGWSRVPVPPKAKLGRAQWHVDTERKVLVCDGDGGHDMLLFDEVLGDAIFHFEFRYTKKDGLKGYNSGAYVRNSPDGAIWHQAQFGDANGGFLFGVTPQAEGKPKFFRKPVKDGRVKPAGEWNTMEMTARGKTITLWVNGAVTCQFDACGRPRGHVGLEGEGYRIEFRNLKVKKLPAKSKRKTARSIERARDPSTDDGPQPQPAKPAAG